LYLKSLVFLQLGDHLRVIKVLDKISKKDPNYVEAMLTKAEAYKRMFKRDKAVKLIKKAFEQNPNNPTALTRLAEITMRPKDKQANLKAMELLDKALKIDPQLDEAWALKGILYYRFEFEIEDKEEGKKCLDKSLKINPNNYRARSIKGRYSQFDLQPVLIREGTINFLNPRIRAEKLKKQLSFDPIAFKPLIYENMVYVHIDGNEDNDDPETHAWVSKDTNKRLKAGTLLKGQQSEIGEQRKLIEQHFETHLGGVNKIIHDQRKDKYHIDIYILPPNDRRNYGVMATSGMSDFGMNCPLNLKFFQFGELYIKLPPDWPYPMEELKQDDYAWVFQNLYLLPRSVHDNRTFFWNGQVIDNDEPFARNTKLSGFLIKYPSTIDVPVEFNMLKVNPQKAICFYQLIPLYNEEMNFLEKNGLEQLYTKFDEYRITDIVDLKRPNTC
jgi:hypothetical protein